MRWKEAMRLADQKIQWHPGFYAGIELELRSFDLEYDQEYQLTKGPLSIDLLIIRKQTDERIDNEIGEFFRKHNVVEFKSPEDELSIDIFYKVQAYAGLYKASGETVNQIPAQEITVSLFRDTCPREMMEQLKTLGAEITVRHDGIYQIEKAGLFPAQLIVTRELKEETHAILRILTNRATRQDVEAFLTATKDMRTEGDIARLDAILQVSATANRVVFDEIYREGEERMCQALKEIMKDDFEKAEARGEARGVAIGEARGVAIGEARGVEKNAIDNIKSLMETTNWSAQQAMDALKIPASKQSLYASRL
jgi:hypothetical protein